jgi:hypothetical protein
MERYAAYDRFARIYDQQRGKDFGHSERPA